MAHPVAAGVEFEAVNHQEKTFRPDLERLSLDADTARDLYRDMKLGRDFEDMCAQMYYRGKMFGFVHLYCGQEAVSTGVIRLLKKRDYVCRRAAPSVSCAACCSLCACLPGGCLQAVKAQHSQRFLARFSPAVSAHAAHQCPKNSSAPQRRAQSAHCRTSART